MLLRVPERREGLPCSPALWIPVAQCISLLALQAAEDIDFPASPGAGPKVHAGARLSPDQGGSASLSPGWKQHQPGLGKQPPHHTTLWLCPLHVWKTQDHPDIALAPIQPSLPPTLGALPPQRHNSSVALSLPAACPPPTHTPARTVSKVWPASLILQEHQGGRESANHTGRAGAPVLPSGVAQLEGLGLEWKAGQFCKVEDVDR